MTDADELRAQIQQAMELGTEAAEKGANAIDDLGAVIITLNKAVTDLLESRAQARAQLDSLVALSDQLELILNGTLNADMLFAQGKVREAIRGVDDYLNRSLHHVNNIQKLSAILRLQLLPILGKETVGSLKQVTDILERWTWNI